MQAFVRCAIAVIMLFAMGSVSIPSASAYSNSYYHARVKNQRKYYRGTFGQRHPKIKATAIGAGVGAGAGALTGWIAGTGVGRGALIGAGTGAGVGLIRSSRTLRRHPIVRDIATGGMTGLGIGWAARRHGGAGKGALIGSAVGLGVGLFKHQDW